MRLLIIYVISLIAAVLWGLNSPTLGIAITGSIGTLVLVALVGMK